MKKLINFILILIAFSFLKPAPVLAAASNLRCTPSTGTFKVGDTFTVEYALDTRSFETFGTDVVALFDTAVIEATTTESTAVTDVTGWGQPSTNTVDNILGKITLEYGNSQPSYTGNTTIGKIVFKAIATGQAQFNFQFFQQYDDTTPGVAKVWGNNNSTNLTNILTDVNNCIYVIEESASAPTAAPTATSGTTVTVEPTQEPLPTQLPRAGSVTTTTSLLGFGFLLIAIGLFMPVASSVIKK